MYLKMILLSSLMIVSSACSKAPEPVVTPPAQEISLTMTAKEAKEKSLKEKKKDYEDRTENEIKYVERNIYQLSNDGYCSIITYGSLKSLDWKKVIKHFQSLGFKVKTFPETSYFNPGFIIKWCE